MSKALGRTGPGSGGRDRQAQARGQLAPWAGNGVGENMCTHSGALCKAALIKSWASWLRCIATGLLQDTRPSSTLRRVARSLSPANGDEQVRLKAQGGASPQT